MTIDPRFQRESGREVLGAAALLLKGAMETVGGVHLIAAAASSDPAPAAEFARLIAEQSAALAECGIVARPAEGARAALAAAVGAAGVGRRAVVIVDARDLPELTADLAASLDAGLPHEAALVIAVAKPAAAPGAPGADGRDLRSLAEHLDMPLLEPGEPQQVKDHVAVAVQMSLAAHSPVAIWLGATVATGGGSVELSVNHALVGGGAVKRQTLADERDLRRLAPASPSIERDAILLAEARRQLVNRFDRRPQRGERVPLGFLVAAPAAPALDEALTAFDLVDRFPILTLGLAHPIDDRPIRDLLAQCHRVVVVEPGTPALERAAAAVAESLRHGEGAAPGSGPGVASVWGRRLPFDRPGLPALNLETAAIIDRLGRLMLDHAGVVGALQPIERSAIRAAVGRADQTAPASARLPQRSPTFAPGSTHRDVAGVLDDLRRDLLDGDYTRRHHKSAPAALIVHADRSVAPLLAQPPHDALVHAADPHAASASASAGADAFIANRSVVVTTDAAVERTGCAAIADALDAGRDAAFIVLAEHHPARTTQGLPPVANADDRRRSAERVERIVRSLTTRRDDRRPTVVRLNPAEREALRAAVEDAVTKPGVAVVIADPFIDAEPSRAQRWQLNQAAAQGYAPQASFDHIDPEVCEHCLQCARRIGDPALTVVSTDHGPKLHIDRSVSVNDGAITRLDVCPAFERVTVLRTREPLTRDARIGRLPPGPIPRPLHARLAVWRCAVAGVAGAAGADVELAHRVIVAAGREMGYHVRFTGAALADGYGAPWAGRVAFTRDDDRPFTDAIGIGGADLLLGGDALEAARAVDSPAGSIASPQRTSVVVNDSPSPTMAQLAGRDAVDAASIDAVLNAAADDDRRFRFPLADACHRLLGDKRLMPLALVGAAYQRGCLPVTLEAVESAIGRITHGHTDARRAFDLGRRIVSHPDRVRRLIERRDPSPQRALRRKAHALRVAHRGGRGRRMARRLIALVEPALAAMAEHRVDPATQRDMAVRAYDCYVWGGYSVAAKYLRRVLEIMRKDDPVRSFAITRAVVWNLARVVLIKDEPYVAALLTSPEKLMRDRREFRVYPARGDRLLYRRDHRPEPVLLGRGFRFTWRSRNWHLRLLARYRWLVRLMPGHARRERIFRDWYKRLVDRAAWSSDADYDRWLAALRTPESVTGFRDVVYPKMDRARAEAEAILAESPAESPAAVEVSRGPADSSSVQSRR